MGATPHRGKAIGHSLWLKAALGLLFFVPPLAQQAFSAEDTGRLVAAVLSRPFSVAFAPLLPVARVMLLSTVVLVFVMKRNSARILLGYYALVLLLVGVFQNMAVTEGYGFVWLVGNTALQLLLCAWCLADLVRHRSTIVREQLNRRRLWVALPMALAFWFPYGVVASPIHPEGIIAPDFSLAVFGNDAGVTYCMVTPIVLGLMVLFSRGIDSGLLSVTAFIGAGFGLLNMVTWFLLMRASWWMGVLHLPLVVLSGFALYVARDERRRRGHPGDQGLGASTARGSTGAPASSAVPGAAALS